MLATLAATGRPNHGGNPGSHPRKVRPRPSSRGVEYHGGAWRLCPGMRFLAAVTILTAALGLAAAPALAEDGTREALAALQRDLGLTPERLHDVGRQQDRAIDLDVKLQASLGDGYAGARFDVRRGVLIVNVTDDSLLEAVKASGAEPRLVKRGLGELEAITAQLNGPPADGAERRVETKPQSTGLTSYYIDPDSNSVHVTVTREHAGAAKDLLARYGDAVTLEVSDETPETLGRAMDGGDAINFLSCSAGFNLRNPSTGQGYLLTAGHCVDVGQTLKGYNQPAHPFGPVLSSWYPTFDDALARNADPGFWSQGPFVDIHPSDGGVIETHGHTDAPVGTIVCKSGNKTLWTCGLITAKNVTVTYTSGDTVYGLTRHSACSEHGDSGGATVSFSFAHGFRAEGLTSGGKSRKKDGRPRCLQVFGEENQTYYFPIADSLAYYGPNYGLTMW